MISDVLFESVQAIDWYLRMTPTAYQDDTLARILALRAEMDAVRAILDTPPSAPAPEDTPPTLGYEPGEFEHLLETPEPEYSGPCDGNGDPIA